MKRFLIMMAALFLLVLSGCSGKTLSVPGQSGNGNPSPGLPGNGNPSSEQPGSGKPASGGGDVIYDELFYDSADGVDFIIGRFGDTYLICEDGNSTWSALASGAPAEIQLNDMEFGSCNADMVYLDGGIAGYIHAPTIDKVNRFQMIPYSDVEQKRLFPKYDPKVDYFSGPRLWNTADGTYCVVYENYGDYRLYKDGKFVNSYENAYEMQVEMGLVSEGPEDATFEQIHKINLYVFRCGEEYLAYSRYEGLDNWTPMLNEYYENVPLDFALENGEAVYLTNARVVKVTTKDWQYLNTPMILDYEGIEKCSLDALSMGTTVDHWEDGPVTEEGELMEYRASEYLIFYLNGQFHVYKEHRPGDEQEGDVYIGSFDTEEETNQAMGK